MNKVHVFLFTALIRKPIPYFLCAQRKYPWTNVIYSLFYVNMVLDRLC